MNLSSRLSGLGFLLVTSVAWIAASFISQALVNGDGPDGRLPQISPLLLALICRWGSSARCKTPQQQLCRPACTTWHVAQHSPGCCHQYAQANTHSSTEPLTTALPPTAPCSACTSPSLPWAHAARARAAAAGAGVPVPPAPLQCAPQQGVPQQTRSSPPCWVGPPPAAKATTAALPAAPPDVQPHQKQEAGRVKGAGFPPRAGGTVDPTGVTCSRQQLWWVWLVELSGRLPCTTATG